MEIVYSIIQNIPEFAAIDLGEAPDEHFSRQIWQEYVEELVEQLRTALRFPTLGLSQAEISAHYHLPLSQFLLLVRSKLI